jgi:hypothetical protein
MTGDRCLRDEQSENRPSLRKAHTASDGITESKLVASNKLANCDKEPNSITSLKPDVAANNSTGRETLGDQLVSYR